MDAAILALLADLYTQVNKLQTINSQLVQENDQLKSKIGE